MRLLWIELKIVRKPGLDQPLNELHGVFHVHVVVARSMHQQQTALQAGRGVHYRKVFVAGGEVGWLAHVTLSIDRIVIMPISNWSHRHARLEPVGVGHGIESESSSPAPPPPAEPVCVKLWVLGQ